MSVTSQKKGWQSWVDVAVAAFISTSGDSFVAVFAFFCTRFSRENNCKYISRSYFEGINWREMDGPLHKFYFCINSKKWSSNRTTRAVNDSSVIQSKIQECWLRELPRSRPSETARTSKKFQLSRENSRKQHQIMNSFQSISWHQTSKWFIQCYRLFNNCFSTKLLICGIFLDVKIALYVLETILNW